MRGRGIWKLLAVMAIVLAVGVAVRAQQDAAQEQEATAGQAGGEAEAPATTEFGAGERTDQMMERIDEILATEEQALAGEAYTYDPEGRRDPFTSLLDARLAPEEGGPRPEGIPGLLVDEVSISGIFMTPEGATAQVQAAAKEKSYLIRVGDRLYDGSVVAISPDEVVFRQEVRDPTALKPFREVVKKLNPQP